jgi:hypothetical protein
MDKDISDTNANTMNATEDIKANAKDIKADTGIEKYIEKQIELKINR